MWLLTNLKLHIPPDIGSALESSYIFEGHNFLAWHKELILY